MSLEERKMKLIYLKTLEKERKKIDKIEDYYELFVSVLNAEDEFLHDHEHLWILGIDKEGFAVCVYVVSLGYSNFSTVEPMKVFRVALQLNAVKVVISQNKPNTRELYLSEDDYDLTNITYNRAKLIGLELVDHIIISNFSLKSEEPFYYSYKEHEVMEAIDLDIRFKFYDEIKPLLDKKKKEYGDEKEAKGKAEGEKNKALEIVKNLLAMNTDIETIIKATGFSKGEIEEIKKKMN